MKALVWLSGLYSTKTKGFMLPKQFNALVIDDDLNICDRCFVEFGDINENDIKHSVNGQIIHMWNVATSKIMKQINVEDTTFILANEQLAKEFDKMIAKTMYSTLFNKSYGIGVKHKKEVNSWSINRTAAENLVAMLNLLKEDSKNKKEEAEEIKESKKDNPFKMLNNIRNMEQQLSYVCNKLGFAIINEENGVYRVLTLSGDYTFNILDRPTVMNGKTYYSPLEALCDIYRIDAEDTQRKEAVIGSELGGKYGYTFVDRLQ